MKDMSRLTVWCVKERSQASQTSFVSLMVIARQACRPLCRLVTDLTSRLDINSWPAQIIANFVSHLSSTTSQALQYLSPNCATKVGPD
jgi:hypothetical protein